MRTRAVVGAVVAMLVVVGVVFGAALTSGPASSTTGSREGVARIDASTGAVTATVPLPSSATRHVRGVTAGDGFVWVADADGVAKIDPGRARVVKQFPLSNGGGHIAYGFKRLWVEDTGSGLRAMRESGSTTNAVSVVSPQSGTVLGRRALQPYGASDYAIGYGSVWAMDPFCCSPNGIDSVYRIRPHPSTDGANRSYPIVARINNVGAVAIGEGHVWEVLNGQVGEIAHNRVHQTGTFIPGAHTIAAGAGAVWVISEAASSVTEINPATGLPTGPATPIDHIGGKVGGYPAAVAGDGYLWVCDDVVPGVVRINAATLQIHRTPLPALPTDITLAGRNVWVTYGPEGGSLATQGKHG